MVMEGNGAVNEYPGGYDDWLRQRQPALPPAPSKKKVVKEIIKKEKPLIPRKLTFKEQRELDDLPQKIEKLEEEQKELYRLLADFVFYQGDPSEVSRVRARSEALSGELSKAYARWEYLEDLSA
jgi:ATP-binding cassette subfamily F protein uup